MIDRRVIASFQPLEQRVHLAVSIAIDTTADVHSISRYIYGTNQPLADATVSTLARLGGNRWTAYNWETNASNAGSDFNYQNDGFLSSSNTPGAAVAPTITTAASHNAATILTIPIAGYASADKAGNGDVRNSGADYLSTRFNQTLARKGSAFSLTPNTTDDFVDADEFVNWVKQTYPAATTNPNTPVWFSLDNEPDLWANTHKEIHPSAVTYAELISKTIDYAKAIKDVMPGTKVFGPASYGFAGYLTLQGAPDAANRDFLDTYLQQLKDASTADGRRLLDTLDLHWYPEANAGGIRITESDSSAAVVAERLQAPRSLWDPTYKENSWIANDYYHGPVDLIPKLKAKIAAKYPGTNLGFSEYNYGGGNHISGGIAQADVLGIFGREGVFSANQWKLGSDESFVNGAFRMFRNFDGAGGAFGDTSIRATTTDVAGSSVYASLDSTNPNVMTIVAINKTGVPNAASFAIAGRRALGAAKAYQLAGVIANPQHVADVAIGAGANAFNFTMPAYSVTTLRIPLVPANAPKVNASSFDYNAYPNTVAYTFDRDVSASLSSDDLSITSGTTTITPTAVTWDPSTNTATFALPAALPDGVYHATLSGTGVSSSGVAMSIDQSLDFHVLAGDANHDRTVDFSDLLIVAKNFGQAGHSFAQGNFDYSGDGVVNFDDLLILAKRYGTSV